MMRLNKNRQTVHAESRLEKRSAAGDDSPVVMAGGGKMPAGDGGASTGDDTPTLGGAGTAVGNDGSAPKKKRWGKVFFSLAFLCGIVLLFYPVVSNLIYASGVYNATLSYDNAVKKYSKEELAQLWADAENYNKELGFPTVKDPFGFKDVISPLDRYYDTLNPDGTGMMCYIEIPSINVRLPVYHSTSEEVLQKGVGHIATTALPINSESSHAVLTGHTGLPDKMLFTNLTLLKKSDIFRLHVLDKTFSYKIDDISVVVPEDTSLLQPKVGETKVSLVTCTPYGINSHRLIVTGSPTTEDEPTQPHTILMDIWIWLVILLFMLIAAFIVTAILKHLKKKEGRVAYARLKTGQL